MPKDRRRQHSHSRNASTHTRNSNPRQTAKPSPPHRFPLSRRPTTHFLSNPNSLQKRKPQKAVKKKLNKLKKKKQGAVQPTHSTIESIGSSKRDWKEHLKLTFRSSNPPHESVMQQSVKCLVEMKGVGRKSNSYALLMKSFPAKQSQKGLLEGEKRVLLIDWLGMVTGELLLRRQTLHLALAFLDAFLESHEELPDRIHLYGAACLMLSVKQEQRGSQPLVLEVLCKGADLTREQILKTESAVVLGLNFKLNFNTLPFWCDYFSQKWDNFIDSDHLEPDTHPELAESLILTRHPEGLCYKFYRQLMQLSDAIVMNELSRQFEVSKLALACLYLVTRIESESQMRQIDSEEVFREYCVGFKQKSTPIFRDKWCFNATFNKWLSDLCDFQITEIVPAIKWVSCYLQMPFVSQIDSRAYQSSQNYEEFLRVYNYTSKLRQYFLEEELMCA